jgi:hypothetical protein
MWFDPPEPKGKLDAMLTDTRVDAVTVNGPEDVLPAWDAIDWRTREEEVRRIRQRIFKAAQEQDWPRVRNLQKLTAPRGALLYPRLSREEFEGRFLGLMPYLELKGEGNHSMAEN